MLPWVTCFWKFSFHNLRTPYKYIWLIDFRIAIYKHIFRMNLRSCVLRSLYPLCLSIDEPPALKLVQALIFSRIAYCNFLYFRIPWYSWKIPQKLLNRVAVLLSIPLVAITLFPSLINYVCSPFSTDTFKNFLHHFQNHSYAQSTFLFVWMYHPLISNTS